MTTKTALLLLVITAAGPLHAHLTGNGGHDATALRFAREFPGQAACLAVPAEASPRPRTGPEAAFARFAPAVRTRTEGGFLFVESNGLPAHGMMIGITAWQQQVPLPQPYTGANAWRIPLAPVAAPQPIPVRDRFLRGAIALAVNGIPIFNPQNNRGELSVEIGELDQWGGHCGRADDYHYHVVPLHLQSVVGEGLPVAYALDGYPILGLKEPDGSIPANLDACSGHETPGLGYHYHATSRYPYVIGAFRGVVVERDGQVDPQPRAQPVRPALQVMRGARITGFAGTPDQRGATLEYAVGARTGRVAYAATGPDTWRFRFTSTEGVEKEETYRAGERRPGEGRPPGGKDASPRKSDRSKGPPPSGRSETPPAQPPKPGSSAPAPAPGALSLRSPAVGADGRLPVEFTGDGAGISPPLAWSGKPAGTRSWAVIMHHLDPAGQVKWYWTLYNLPAETTDLPKDASGIGVLGSNGVNRRIGYAPPHSKGPGDKTYTLTIYALSSPLDLREPPQSVDRAVLLRAMEGRILGQASLDVTCTRSGNSRP